MKYLNFILIISALIAINACGPITPSVAKFGSNSVAPHSENKLSLSNTNEESMVDSSSIDEDSSAINQAANVYDISFLPANSYNEKWKFKRANKPGLELNDNLVAILNHDTKVNFHFQHLGKKKQARIYFFMNLDSAAIKEYRLAKAKAQLKFLPNSENSNWELALKINSDEVKDKDPIQDIESEYIQEKIKESLKNIYIEFNDVE